MSTPAWLSRVKLDWSRFEEASRVSRDIVEELAANRPLLRALVLKAAESGQLRMMAEKHNELNYIVLYDALDRGLRVRLHKFTHGLEDIPHNHRFSFSSAILSGSYVHTMFQLDRASEGAQRELEWRLDQPPGSYVGRVDEMHLVGLTTLLTTTQSAGSSYSMHHEAVHKTAMPVSDAYSVFVRGPAQKPCSLQLAPDKRAYRWKFGREQESADVVSDRVMSPAEYDQFVEGLEAAAVI